MILDGFAAGLCAILGRRPMSSPTPALVVARERSRRALRRGLLAGFVLHALIALWIWWRWTPALRGTVLAVIDLPLSLVFGGTAGGRELAWSLLVGGAQWAALGALAGLLVERLTAPANASKAP